MEIAIVDVGLGNLRSVERALIRAAEDAGTTARVAITRDPDAIARADKVVVPGQGAFRDCARALGDGGLGEAVCAGAFARGTPYLGICLGMQGPLRVERGGARAAAGWASSRGTWRASEIARRAAKR